jgi:hypothetical protein
MFRCIAALIVAAGIAAARPIGAQESLALRPGTACQTCKIVLTRVATLTSDQFPIDDSRMNVLRDNAGNFLVPGDKSTSIGVFSPTGKFLRRVGRRGDRPGEFRTIGAMVIGPGDSVHVFDSGLGRRTVFDPTLTTAVRTIPVPRFGDVALAKDDAVLVSGHLPTRESAGQPLHLVGRDGGVARSFGAENQTVNIQGNESRRLYRAITRARGGGFWVAPATEYTIERWSDQFTRERVLRRSVDWFPPLPPDAVLRSPESDRPPTMLRSIWEEPSGLLLANLGVAAADWRATASGDEERPATAERDLSKYIDTIIEAIDPRSGTVLATHRARGILGQIRNGPYLWALRGAGAVAIDVFRMEYVQQ